jgi:hypothetical protein
VQAVSGLRFTGAAAGLSLAAAAYCLIHGFVIDVETNLPRTLAWAVTSTLPWLCAWEGLKRLDQRPAQSLQLLRSAVMLTAALVVCVALEYALGAIYSTATDSLAQIVYRLLPIPFGIAVVRWLVRPSKPVRASPTDLILDCQHARARSPCGPAISNTSRLRAAMSSWLPAIERRSCVRRCRI